MGQIQHIPLSHQRQALHRQKHHFSDLILTQIADALQSRLHDLLEGMGSRINPVHILIIIQLFHGTGTIHGVFNDGQSHIRLHGHQPSVPVGKGNHLVGNQKVLVPDIQLVFLEPAHFVMLVAEVLVQLPQGKNRFLLIAQNLFVILHWPLSPLPSTFSEPSHNRRSHKAGTC